MSQKVVGTNPSKPIRKITPAERLKDNRLRLLLLLFLLDEPHSLWAVEEEEEEGEEEVKSQS